MSKMCVMVVVGQVHEVSGSAIQMQSTIYKDITLCKFKFIMQFNIATFNNYLQIDLRISLPLCILKYYL